MILVNKWLYVHLSGQFFVVLWTTNLYNAITGLFIPIAGRSGGEKIPDVNVAILCCAVTIYIIHNLVNKNNFTLCMFLVD